MLLKDKLQADLITAMKSGNTQKRDVLRMLDSMIKNVEIEKNKREQGLTEDEIIEIIGRAVKQRKDSVRQYKEGGRNDLAEKEREEIGILSEYLPKQMSEAELLVIVKKIMAQMKIENKSEFGKVMGMTMNKVKGRADGNLVREIIEKEFESL